MTLTTIIVEESGQMVRKRIGRCKAVGVAALMMVFGVLLIVIIDQLKEWRLAKRMARYEETAAKIWQILENSDDAKFSSLRKDAWGRRILIKMDGANVYIRSTGEDVQDEEDDIVAKRIYHDDMEGYNQDILYHFDGVVFGGGVCAD